MTGRDWAKDWEALQRATQLMKFADFAALACEAFPYWLQRAWELKEALKDCIQWYQHPTVQQVFALAVTHDVTVSTEFAQWAGQVWEKARILVNDKEADGNA